MKIKFGTTRIVFVFTNFVVKMPLIPAFYFFQSLFRNLKNGTVQKRVDYHNIGPGFMVRFFLRGFIANYLEWKYCIRNRNDKRIIPVYGLFYGLIIIQPKGHNFLTSGVRWKRKLKRLIFLGVKDEDLLVAHNYSLWKGEILLHDYGSKRTQEELKIIPWSV